MHICTAPHLRIQRDFNNIFAYANQPLWLKALVSLAMSAFVDSVDPDDCNRRIFELAKTIDRALQGIFKLLPEETKPLQRSADHFGLALGPNVSGRDGRGTCVKIKSLGGVNM